MTRVATVLGEQHLAARGELRVGMEGGRRLRLVTQEIARDVHRLEVVELRVRHSTAGPNRQRVLEKFREAGEGVLLRHRPERHRVRERRLRRVARDATDGVIQLPPALDGRGSGPREGRRRAAERGEVMRERVRRGGAFGRRQMAEHSGHRGAGLGGGRVGDEFAQMRAVRPRADGGEVRAGLRRQICARRGVTRRTTEFADQHRAGDSGRYLLRPRQPADERRLRAGTARGERKRGDDDGNERLHIHSVTEPAPRF